MILSVVMLSVICVAEEQCDLNIINNCLSIKISIYLGTSSGQSFNLYLNTACFSTLDSIRHLWHLKTVIFLHRYQMYTVLLSI